MGSPGMWRRVFVRTGSCTAKVRTHAPATVRRQLSSWPPCPAGAGSRGLRLPCPATGAAAGGSGVGSSPSSDEAARGYARRAAPVARDLRVRLSGRHARRRDPDCRVSVGRTTWRRGCVSSSFAKGRLCRSIEPSSAELQAWCRRAGAIPQRLDRRPDQKRPALLIGRRRLGAAELDRKARRSGRCSGGSSGGAVADRGLTPQSINLILKRRCAMAGLDPRDYSAHRLRAGYSPKRRVEGLRCSRRCSSRSTVRCSRRRAITTRSTGRRAGRCA